MSHHLAAVRGDGNPDAVELGSIHGLEMGDHNCQGMLEGGGESHSVQEEIVSNVSLSESASSFDMYKASVPSSSSSSLC